MPNPVSEDARDILLDAGVGSSTVSDDWAVFVGNEPDGSGVPDAVITIYDTGGPERDPKFLIDYPTFQVRVRGNEFDYLDAAGKLEEAIDALNGFPSQDYNGIRYVGIWTTSDIISLGKTESRPILVCNFRTIREPVTGTYRQSL